MLPPAPRYDNRLVVSGGLGWRGLIPGDSMPAIADELAQLSLAVGVTFFCQSVELSLTQLTPALRTRYRCVFTAHYKLPR